MSRPSMRPMRLRRVSARDRPRVHQPAVPQHGHRVADPEDLVEPMRHVDDGHALRARSSSIAANRRSTSLGSSDEVGSSMISTRCRSATARAMATVCWAPRLSSWSGRRTSTLHAVALHHRDRPGPHPVEVHEAQAVRRLASQEQVAGHAELRHQVDLLVDGADASQLGVARAGETGRCAQEPQLARVGLVDAGHALDERRLARAVLADEGVHLARTAGPWTHRRARGRPPNRLLMPRTSRTGGSATRIRVESGRRRQLHPGPRVPCTGAAPALEGDGRRIWRPGHRPGARVGDRPVRSGERAGSVRVRPARPPRCPWCTPCRR